MFIKGQMLKCIKNTRSHVKDQIYTFQTYVFENSDAMYTVEAMNVWNGISHDNFIPATIEEINQDHKARLAVLIQNYDLAISIAKSL